MVKKIFLLILFAIPCIYAAASKKPSQQAPLHSCRPCTLGQTERLAPTLFDETACPKCKENARALLQKILTSSKPPQK